MMLHYCKFVVIDNYVWIGDIQVGLTIITVKEIYCFLNIQRHQRDRIYPFLDPRPIHYRNRSGYLFIVTNNIFQVDLDILLLQI